MVNYSMLQKKLTDPARELKIWKATCACFRTSTAEISKFLEHLGLFKPAFKQWERYQSEGMC